MVLLRSALVSALCALVIAGAQAAAVVGKPAPDFTLASSTGANLRLSEMRGQVVLVNFWASWCGPCRQELPLLDRLYKQYRGAGLMLLGVNVDESRAKGEDMARRLGLGFPVLFDSRQQVIDRYGPREMPSTVLIDRDGKVRYIHLGYRDGYDKLYEQQIRELLKE